jgi:hypothetical protein
VTSSEPAHHGWLDAPWQDPAEAVRDSISRTRRIYRKVTIVAGAVLVVTMLLPWDNRYVWIQYPAGSAHRYVSLSSTFGLTNLPWGTLVPVTGVALILVALWMVPDRRSVGVVMTLVASAGVVCCLLAIKGIEQQFLAGLNQAEAWGGCGGPNGTPCTALTLQNPLRAACGLGAFVAAGAALVALVTGVAFTVSTLRLPGSSPTPSR